MGYKRTYNDIKCIDVDISNICNLKCPLCASNIFGAKLEKHFADINTLVSKIQMFKNVEAVHIAGAASEPTLHPQLFDFIDKLSSNGLRVNLFTNGSTHNEEYWSGLAQLMKPEFKTIFTVCGTTQALHEKYRVGSQLEKVLRNAEAYRSSTSSKNDYVQYIRFQYNSFETDAQIMKFLKDFSHVQIMNSDCVYERANIGTMHKNDGICLPSKFQAKYKACICKALKKDKLDICCNSFENGVVQMDPFGEIYPCSAWRILNCTKFGNDGTLDYSDIMSGSHKCCLECDRDILEFLDSQDVDPFYMCNNE